MSTREEMSKIDGLPLRRGNSAGKVSQPVAFQSPYKNGDELFYIETPKQELLFGYTPEKTIRVVYIGHSYIDDGNDAPPRAMVNTMEIRPQTLRVPFSRLKPVS